MENMYVFKNGSIISMEYATHGTLLSVVLAYKNALVSKIFYEIFKYYFKYLLNFVLLCAFLK